MVDACTAKWSSVSLSLFSFFFFLTCRVEADDVYPLTSQVGGGVHHQRILKCSERAREHWLGAGPGGGHTLLECWEPWTSSSSSDIRSKLASVNPARRLLFYYSPVPSCCMHACSCSGRTRHRACHPSGLMNLMEGSKADTIKQARSRLLLLYPAAIAIHKAGHAHPLTEACAVQGGRASTHVRLPAAVLAAHPHRVCPSDPSILPPLFLHPIDMHDASTHTCGRSHAPATSQPARTR